MKAPTPEEIRATQEWQRREAKAAYTRELNAINAELTYAENAACRRRAAVEKYYQQELYRINNPCPASMEFRASRATYTVVIGDVTTGSRSPFWSIDHDRRIVTLGTNLISIDRQNILRLALVEAAIHLNPGPYGLAETKKIETRIETTMDEDFDRQGGPQRLTNLLPRPADFKNQRKPKPEPRPRCMIGG
jgi:hypothetical protein